MKAATTRSRNEDEMLERRSFLGALAGASLGALSDGIFAEFATPQNKAQAGTISATQIPFESARREVVYSCVTQSPDRTRILAAVQRPISVQCIEENAPAPGWKSKPSWFLLAEGDRMINPKTQRFMAGRMGAKVRSSRVDHSPMYSAPDFAIDVILEAASVTLGDGSLPGRAATG
jgi:hypothetical protein